MKWNHAIAVLLTGAMLLTGLAGCGKAEEDTGSGEKETTAVKQAADVKAVDTFTLAYNEKDGLDPLSWSSAENQMMMPLCFESLFQLDDHFEPQPVLCDSMEQENTRSYNLTIRSGILFHSGQEMTVEDVVYSLNNARLRENSIYQDKLSCISSVKYNDDEIHVRLYTSKSERELQALLDVPIFRKGSEEDEIPDGSGPYQVVRQDSALNLIPFEQWSGGKVGYCSSITLKSVSDSSGAANLLSSGEISMLLQQDAEKEPITGAKYTSSVPTTRLHYLGINCDWAPLDEEDVRTALSMLMDREMIVQTCFAGRADAASLPMVSIPESIEAPKYDKAAALELLEDAGIYDRDSDGYLDISNGRQFKLEIIYNEQYSTKGAVLEQYASTLNEAGIQTTVTPLSFEDCQSKLRRETFQIYYGEYEMTPDFDLSSIISDGGERNFGNFYSRDMQDALSDLHEGQPEEYEQTVEDYLECFMEETPILPIAFERNLISSATKLPEGFDPWPNDIFHGIETWSAS